MNPRLERGRLARGGLAVGGSLIAAAAITLAFRTHREQPTVAGWAALAGVVIVQLGLALLTWNRLRRAGRTGALATALVIGPPIAITIGLVLFWAGAPWEASGLIAGLAVVLVPIGWMAFGAVAIQTGLVSTVVAAAILWSVLLLFLFQPSSARALAAVPLGLAWIVVAARARLGGVALSDRIDMRTALVAVVAIAVASGGLVAATRMTARPAGVPGPGPAALSAPIVIDTDSQPDDWMAIAYLLSRPDADIRAITVAGSSAMGCEASVRQVLRLLAAADRRGVPVACGSAALPGGHPFPADFGAGSAAVMAEVDLPDPIDSPDPRTAVEVLTQTVQGAPAPVLVIALGPLTNLAEAFAADVGLRDRLRAVVVMGGAVDVGGNTGGGPAEWNIYADPGAASSVFRAGVPITLVALDATNDVRISMADAQLLEAVPDAWAARAVGGFISAQRAFVESGEYYFWDPLAAVVAADDRVAGFLVETLDVLTSGAESGRVVRSPFGGSMRLAVSADGAAFRRAFVEALSSSGQ